jgi:ankyrin repeat protein
MACACEHADLAKLLIAIGADTTLRDLDGCTAVELAPPSIVPLFASAR